MTAISGAQLAKQAISTQRDLQIAVPGLTVRADLNADQLNYSVRGQTIDPFTYSQPGVLPYVNEYQVPAGYSAEALYDLSSIQVLKGPQGTLFGRNAIGGAVLITTQQPTNKWTGYATARAGDYGLKEFEGAVNAPINDQLSFRLAGRLADSGGYFKNLVTNHWLGREQTAAVRGTLKWKPTDYITDTLVVDYTSTTGTSIPGRVYSNYALGSSNNGTPLYSTASFLYSPLADSVFGPGFFEAYAAANGLTGTAAAGGLSAYYDSVKNQNPNSNVSLNTDPHVEGKNITLINTTVVNLNADTAVKSILGYTRSISAQDSDVDGTPFNIESVGDFLDIKQFSSELQLAGKTLHGNLQYVGGLYYTKTDTVGTQNAIFFSFEPIAAPLADFTYRAEDYDESRAAYAQGTYDFSNWVDGLSLTFGARYTNERVALNQVPGGLFYQLFGHASEATIVNKINWQTGLQYQLTKQILTYAKVGTSFRTGGFNLGSAPINGTAITGGNGFNPERTTAYEIGSKFDGHVAGMPTRVNLAAFYQVVDDVQRAVYFVPPGSAAVAGFTANVPQATIKGIELDGFISPYSWLQLGAAGALTDAKFTGNTAEFFGQIKQYGPYPDTPAFSGSVYGEVDVPINERIADDVSFRSDAFYQSTSYFGSLNDTSVPGTKISPYTVVNFRVALENLFGTKLTFATYLKNAFDEKYYVGGIPTGSVESVNTAVPGAPRTWFAELNYKF